MWNALISTSTLQAIKDAMTPVALAIGKGAEYGWTVLIKQQYVYATLGAGWAVLGLTIFISSIFVWKWACKKETMSDSEGFSIAVAVFASLAGLAALIIGGSIAITHFLNPDYYALQFLLDTVKANK